MSTLQFEYHIFTIRYFDIVCENTLLVVVVNIERKTKQNQIKIPSIQLVLVACFFFFVFGFNGFFCCSATCEKQMKVLSEFLFYFQ